MKPVHQTLFGSPDSTPDEVGNCYPACIATLLELPLADVPHVYALHPKDDDAACYAMLEWLQARRFTSMSFSWAPWVHRYLLGAPCIVTGKSPRGDFMHAVVGEVTAEGWKLLHDPHPSGAGIISEPTTVEVLVPYLRSAA